MSSLFSDIDSLIIYNKIHEVVFGKFYRMLSRRFPFAVYYLVEGDEVIVHAVLDCRKSLARIRERLNP